MTARPFRRAAARASSTVVVLAACSAIPTSGPVSEGDAEVTEPVRDRRAGRGAAAGGHPDRDRRRVPRGRRRGLHATTSRRPGSTSRARRRRPGSRRPASSSSRAGRARADDDGHRGRRSTSPSLARVDEDGVYAEAPPDARESVTFGMVQDDADQWRIAATPPRPDPASRRTSAGATGRPSLYFLVARTRSSSSPSRAGSRRRTCARRSSASCSPVRRRGCRTRSSRRCPTASSSTPSRSRSTTRASPRSRLAPALAVTRADRDLLLAQIDASLRPVPGIGSVQVYAGDVPLEGAATLQRGSGPPSNVEFLQDDRIVRARGRRARAGARPRRPRRARPAQPGEQRGRVGAR